MAFDGTYKITHDENFLEFFKEIGSLPVVVETVAYKKHFKHILSDGNKYTIKLTDHNSDTLSEMKFQLGVPISQDTPGKQVLNYIEDGNLITKWMTDNEVTLKRTLTRTKNRAVVIVESDKTTMIGKRFFEVFDL